MNDEGLKNIERTGRIFIDCTATYQYDAHTGIQRVVRNIIVHARKTGCRLGVDCQPAVFSSSAGFKPVEGLRATSSECDSMLDRARSVNRGMRETVRSWLAMSGFLETAQRFRSTARRRLTVALRPLQKVLGRRIQFRRGDVLLLLDASWTTHFWNEVRAARACGALVGVVVYDLTPIQYPHYFTDCSAQTFSRWWQTARRVADFYVCISQSIWEEVRDLESAAQNGDSRNASRGGAFRLGAELDKCSGDTKVRADLQQLFDGSPPQSVYLMVGTLSPRKNYALALDAFDSLWERGSNTSLLIVGQVGWKCQELVSRIQSHPQYNRQLFWFDDVKDDELDYSYRHSAALITASHAEGFNLPIVESLRRGTPVLASDLPVHREVGRDFAAYFPLDHPLALVRLIEEHQRHGLPPGIKPPEAFNWPDWDQSCRELMDKVVELSKCCIAERRLGKQPLAPAGRRRAA